MTDKSTFTHKQVRAQFRTAGIALCCVASMVAAQSAPSAPPHEPGVIKRSFSVKRPTANAYAFTKSVAQVETLVSPEVSPKSCGLKPRKDGRKNPLTVRLSDIERSIVIQKARQAGCSINAYIRAAALGFQYKPPADPALTRALLLLARELTAHGNNLNQLAHKHNAEQVTSKQANSMLDILGPAILRTLQAVRQALSRDLAGPMP